VLDDDGHGAEDVYVRAKVTKCGSELEVDLSDSHPQVTGFINSSYPNMRSAVVVALAYLIDPDTPKNDGAFRPVSVVAKEGTVVWARPGAPVTLCTNHCGQEIIEAIIKALAPACPERAMAGWGRRFRIALQGKDPAHRQAVHLAHVPGAAGWRRVARGRRLAGRGRVAGCRRHQVRQSRGGRGALSAVLPAPRVPPRQRRRRPPPRRAAGAELELVVEVAEPAVANTAGDGVRHGACGILGGRNGVPHRSATTTVLLRQGDRAHATEIGWLDIALAET
jgi:N-methylhydantoinase B